MNCHVVPTMVNLRTMVFPVVGTRPEKKTEAVKPIVYGTAFCVGPGIFVTAGHVIDNVASDGGLVTLLDLQPQEGAVPYCARGIEKLPCDVGVIACPVPEALALLSWEGSPLSLLTDVSAIGFPYAISKTEEPPTWRVLMRGFKGHVVTRTQLWAVPDVPVGYEVSCPFPKGLSGAPLIRADAPIPELKVAGVVVGSGQVEVEGEITHFGQAVDIQVFADIKSRIVGGTFRELRDKLLVDRRP